MRNLFLISILLISLGSIAQTNTNTDEQKTTVSVATPAKFNGGEAALQRYLAKKTVYPELALENDVQGEVMVMFVVNRQGDVENVTVVSKKIGFGLEMEAMRVVKSTSGMWTPAMQKGEVVAMRFQIPIRFHLEPKTPKKKKRRKK
ncbi:MAG: energy transducer TonB [Bacteroidia bacterium]|nr:energy transducer TonB [Bacteroidia bacterium]